MCFSKMLIALSDQTLQACHGKQLTQCPRGDSSALWHANSRSLIFFVIAARHVLCSTFHMLATSRASSILASSILCFVIRSPLSYEFLNYRMVSSFTATLLKSPPDKHLIPVEGNIKVVVCCFELF